MSTWVWVVKSRMCLPIDWLFIHNHIKTLWFVSEWVLPTAPCYWHIIHLLPGISSICYLPPLVTRDLYFGDSWLDLGYKTLLWKKAKLSSPDSPPIPPKMRIDGPTMCSHGNWYFLCQLLLLSTVLCLLLDGNFQRLRVLSALLASGLSQCLAHPDAQRCWWNV